MCFTFATSTARSDFDRCSVQFVDEDQDDEQTQVEGDGFHVILLEQLGHYSVLSIYFCVSGYSKSGLRALLRV